MTVLAWTLAALGVGGCIVVLVTTGARLHVAHQAWCQLVLDSWSPSGHREPMPASFIVSHVQHRVGVRPSAIAAREIRAALRTLVERRELYVVRDELDGTSYALTSKGERLSL